MEVYAELVKLADYGIDPKLRVLTNVEKNRIHKRNPNYSATITDRKRDGLFGV